MDKIPQIKWRKDDPETGSYSGTDEQGNKWYMTANREWVGVDLKDERNGSGWTIKEAWECAHGIIRLKGDL